MKPFSICFHHGTPHGAITAVSLPTQKIDVAPDILARLPLEERTYAETLRGYRKIQFVGGRIALAEVLNRLGVRPQPCLPNSRGAPSTPADISASISHKSEIAIAMATRSNGATLGVDIETLDTPRTHIARSILTESEYQIVSDLPPLRMWTATLLAFSIKESIYKALDPYVERYVSFKEAEVHPNPDGTVEVQLHLKHQEGPFLVQARYDWIRGYLVTSARVSSPQNK